MKKINKISEKKVSYFFTAPPSKAHTLRAIILGALASGKSIIRNPLFGADQIAMLECMNKLGIEVNIKKDQIIINGSSGIINPVSDELYVNESGVSMNFLISFCSLCNSKIIITGAEGLIKRPVYHLVDSLKKLNVNIEYLDKIGYPPVKIISNGLNGGKTEIDGSITSQYFSSLAICAPYAKNKVIIDCINEMTEKPYFDISVDMMKMFGVNIINNNYKNIIIDNKDKYKGIDITIEGDFSSASYFFVAAAICNIKLEISGLNIESIQGDKKIIEILKKMGCIINYKDDKIIVESKVLKSIDIDLSNSPDLVPSVAIASAFANGESIIRNIGHLKFKESDRISAIINELKKMGVKAYYEKNDLYINGSKNIKGAIIDSYNDHRIAMSFAIAGLVTGGQYIKDFNCVNKSFPDFWEKIKIFFN